MLQWLSQWLSNSSGFSPRGDCYAWNNALVSVEWLSHVCIGFSFIAISLTLRYLARAGKALPSRWMTLALGSLILACGLSQFVEALVIWQPWYWLEAAVRCVAAVAAL